MTRNRRNALLILGLLLLLFGSFMLFKGEPSSNQVASNPPLEVTQIGDSRAKDSKASDASVKERMPFDSASQDGSQPGCYTVEFRHKHSGKTSAQACSRHRNEIALTPKATAVCVQVDGAPVEFKREGGKVAFAGIAGPDSIVGIRYCIGKPKCDDPCRGTKDPFMAAIGAEAKAKRQGKKANQAIESRWNGGVRDGDPDVSAQLAPELLSDEPEVPARTGSSIFKDWYRASMLPGCTKKIASSL